MIKICYIKPKYIINNLISEPSSTNNQSLNKAKTQIELRRQKKNTTKIKFDSETINLKNLLLKNLNILFAKIKCIQRVVLKIVRFAI